MWRPSRARCVAAPRLGEQGLVAEALARPILEVLDRLAGLGAIEMPTQILAPDDAHQAGETSSSSSRICTVLDIARL